MAIAEIDLNSPGDTPEIDPGAEPIICPHCGERSEATCGACGHTLTAGEIRAARDALRERVVARVQAGEAVAAVAAAEGLAHQTVGSWLEGVERPARVVGRDGRTRPSHKPDDESVALRRQEVAQLSRLGLTAREIADKLGVDAVAVQNDRKANRRAEKGGGPARDRAPRLRVVPDSGPKPDSGLALLNQAVVAARELAEMTRFHGGVPVANPVAAQRLVDEAATLLPAIRFSEAVDLADEPASRWGRR